MANYQFHPAHSRGIADFGWLQSAHSFSFGQWYHPEKMGFGLLRVLNDDKVAPGEGFGMHPHDNMEIISIPLSGALAHHDSMGNSTTIKTGEVQIMSAGTGIHHAEFNQSNEIPVEFLQIWIFPATRNRQPAYDQRAFNEADSLNKLQTLVSPDGEGIFINQQAWISRVKTDQDLTISYNNHQHGQGLYVFVLEGEAKIGQFSLQKRDALGISEQAKTDIQLQKGVDLLLFEVPMA
jgi:redox-sensitive bicupin YhaK (pirin superfamily)